MEVDENVAVAKKHVHPTTHKVLKLLETALTRALSIVEQQEFTDAYKEIFSTTPFKRSGPLNRPPLSGSSNEAKEIRDKVRKRALSALVEDISAFFEDMRFDEKFVLLDKIKGDLNQLPETQKAWRPPGHAKLHMKKVEAALTLNDKKELTTKVSVEQEKLETVMKRVEAQRQKIKKLEAEIALKSETLGKYVK